MNAVVAELERLTGAGARLRQGGRKSRLPAFVGRWAAAAAVVVTAVALPWALIPGAPRRPDPVAAVIVPVELLPIEDNNPPPVMPPAQLIHPDHPPVRWTRFESFLDHADALAHQGRTLVRLAAVTALPRTPRVEMVAIKPGGFNMGPGEPGVPQDEKARNWVRITKPFEIGKFEVTQEEFEAVTGRNPSHFTPKTVSDLKDTHRHPVETVSWLDAVQFCNRLSLRHGLKPYYRVDGRSVVRLAGPGYRLPTEAEWEYACRAGTKTRWSFGDDMKELDRYAWHAGNSDNLTHPVGKKLPNPWGLHDMYGNVPEWCWDRFEKDPLANSPAIDPPGPPGDGDLRVVRGGAWNGREGQAASDSRSKLGIAYGVEGGLHHIGFRVARDLEP
jgi:formylglycine-generating enzyme required for sulfatase activity